MPRVSSAVKDLQGDSVVLSNKSFQLSFPIRFNTHQLFGIVPVPRRRSWRSAYTVQG